jgi:hypothetical protein
MSTWIAVLSNNLDGEIRELEVEAESDTEAQEKLEAYVYSESWKHYSLVTIKKSVVVYVLGLDVQRELLELAPMGKV